jgi:hypothetical protein
MWIPPPTSSSGRSASAINDAARSSATPSGRERRACARQACGSAPQLRLVEGVLAVCDVLGQRHHHRSGPARCRNRKRASDGLFTRAVEAGEYLMAQLRALEQRHSMIGEVRGRGLLVGVEFVADRATRRPFDASLRITDRVVQGLRDRNVLVAAGVPLSNFGKDGDHIQISPPFTITHLETDLLVAALGDTLATIAREL